MSKPWHIALQNRGGTGVAEVCTFHVLDTPGVTGSGLSAGGIADEVYNWVHTDWNNCLDTNSVFDRIVSTEDVTFWIPGTLGSAGVHTVGTNGARAAGDNLLPREMCMFASIKTDVAKRYARGGFHSPSITNSAALNTGGGLNTSHANYLDFQTFGATLLGGHDYGTGTSGGHLSLIVYSIAQRKRGATNYWFDAKSITINSRPKWLRQRVSIP